GDGAFVRPAGQNTPPQRLWRSRRVGRPALLRAGARGAHSPRAIVRRSAGGPAAAGGVRRRGPDRPGPGRHFFLRHAMAPVCPLVALLVPALCQPAQAGPVHATATVQTTVDFDTQSGATSATAQADSAFVGPPPAEQHATATSVGHPGGP